MSQMATNEYIGAKRRVYALADRAKRIRILDEVCETTGYERKYANRLLTGSRKFRERKGRGKTYGTDVAETLKKVWLEAGCPCLPYFKAAVEEWMAGHLNHARVAEFSAVIGKNCAEKASLNPSVNRTAPATLERVFVRTQF